MRDPADLPYICTTAEAGLLLRRTPEYMTRLAANGTIPAWKEGNGWLFRRSDLLDYIARQFMVKEATIV